MQESRVSGTLSAEDQAAVMQAIATIRERMPFLTDLTPEERRALPKMGNKSRTFVTKALDVAIQNMGIVPRAFDVDEFKRDVELALALFPILTALDQLQELVDDTYVAVGSEAYAAALLIYNVAKAHGKGEGLDVALDEMGQRFARKSRGLQQKTAET